MSILLLKFGRKCFFGSTLHLLTIYYNFILYMILWATRGGAGPL